MSKKRYMLVNVLVRAGSDDHWVFSDDINNIITGAKSNLNTPDGKIYIKDLSNEEVIEVSI